MKTLIAIAAMLVCAKSAPAAQDVTLTWTPRPSHELVNCYQIWEGFIVPRGSAYFVRVGGDFTVPPARLTNVPAGLHFFVVTASFKVRNAYVMQSFVSKAWPVLAH